MYTIIIVYLAREEKITPPTEILQSMPEKEEPKVKILSNPVRLLSFEGYVEMALQSDLFKEQHQVKYTKGERF